MSVTTISPQRLEELRHAGQPIELIDVRTPLEFREIHVEYARNEPLDRLDPCRIMASRAARAHEPLYLICRSGKRGEQACEKFLAAGFTTVVNVEGGTVACEQAGLAVVRGKKAMSLERQVRLVAGLMALTGAVLGIFVHPYWSILPAMVGAGLTHAALTDSCMMGMLLARMPWNQVAAASSATATTSDPATEPTGTCCR